MAYVNTLDWRGFDNLPWQTGPLMIGVAYRSEQARVALLPGYIRITFGYQNLYWILGRTTQYLVD